MSANLVLHNGKIITVDPKESRAEGVAVKFGRILAVGSTKDVKSYSDSKTKLIDLKGKTVLPGLIESHCHPSLAEGIDRVMGVKIGRAHV